LQVVHELAELVVLARVVQVALEQLGQTPMAAEAAEQDFTQLEVMLLVLTVEQAVKAAAVVAVLVGTEQLLEMVELEVMV
jgi:hypothetical protein